MACSEYSFVNVSQKSRGEPSMPWHIGCDARLSMEPDDCRYVCQLVADKALWEQAILAYGFGKSIEGF